LNRSIKAEHSRVRLRAKGSTRPRPKAANPDFALAHPAAVNPVLRKPPHPDGKVSLENAEAIAFGPCGREAERPAFWES
jgi:hypothetical protein